MAGFENSFRPKPGMEKKESAMKERPMEHSDGEAKVHELHEHGDGSFHTVTHDGAQEEHPTHLHALAHLAHHVSGGEKHHLVHHDGLSLHSHGIHEDGQHDGPHDHENLEELKGSMDKFLGEEGEEGQKAEPDNEDEEGPVMGGM